MKYTKGPWRYALKKLFRPPPGQYILVGREGPYQPIVAHVLKQIGSAENQPEAEGNALLISKAPAMYEALKKIKKSTDVVLDRASVSDGELFLANDIFSIATSALEGL